MVRILLVDEQKVIREGLRVLLESESDLEIVAAVGNGYAAITKIDETNPDILFISMRLSEIEGLDVLAIIRKKYPQVKIIVFSDGTNEQHLIQSLEMGIKGYLLKDTPMEEIVEAIYLVDKGYTHIANGAYDTFVPQMSETLSELNTPKPEIVFSDTSEYKELPQWNTAETPLNEETQEDVSDSLSTHETNSPNLETDPSPESPVPLLMMEATRIDNTASSASLPSAKDGKNNHGVNRYFSIISLASLGLLATSLGVISVISRRSPPLVIENAIINGKTVPINSPIQGKITKINYPKGASVTVDSVIATIDPLFGDRSDRETNQLQEQVQLKQQQQTVAQQSLAFLESSLESLERELATGNPEQLNSLLERIHLNQIKYQEIALKTARIREDAAKRNYEDLVQLRRLDRVSKSQLNSAKNSWELAQLAIEEITIKLEGTRQEYELIKKQIAGNQQQKDNEASLKIARLKQQIASQKTSLNLLQKELDKLDNKLVLAVSEAVKDQSVAIKSPISGAVYTQQYSEGEMVEIADPIATIIDCNNLWVEATVESEIINGINTQEPVLVTVTENNLSLEGKISAIESLSTKQQESNNVAQQIAIKTEIPANLAENNYTRVLVRVPFVVDQLNKQKFCSVGQTARLSFGEKPDLLVSRWGQQWFSNIIAISSQPDIE